MMAGIWRLASRSFHRLTQRIRIEPKESLTEENQKITISELNDHQAIAIHAEIRRTDIGHFECFANYTANDSGIVDVTTQPSEGGFYKGLEPMGLFWGMRPSPGNDRNQNRLIPKNVDQPVQVLFRVFDGHLQYEELQDSRQRVLAATTARRWFQKPGVRRIPVRWKSIRGTLFVPEGPGPFPAVIDVFGTVGGLLEHRASLLASKGYISLALAVFDYDDLPHTLQKVDLEYFEEAKEFLESHPKTQQGGIGIIGTSYGGTLALTCTTYIPGFKCCISVSGSIFVFYKPLRYKGRVWDSKPVDKQRMVKSGGAIITRNSLDKYFYAESLGNSMIEFAESDKDFLFIFGEDDMAYNVPKAVSFTKCLLKSGKGTYKIVTYPEAGHLLEPPNIPHVGATYVKILKAHQKWGGKPYAHARAQEQSWREILSFLKRSLAKPNAKL